MPVFAHDGLDIEYEFIQPEGPEKGTVILIHGLGCQMIQWPYGLVQALLDAGYAVLRFDNRDVGLSRLHEVDRPVKHGPTAMLRWRLGASLPSVYSLKDMAADALALMDHLGIQTAHIAGASMGGMISQELALMAAQRVASMTLIMTTSGRRSVGLPKLSVMRRLFQSPNARDREGWIAHLTQQWMMLQGSGYRTDADLLRPTIEACLDRGMSGLGFVRQSQAVLNAENREARLAQLKTPSLILHGDEDPLIHVSGGRALAKVLPNSELQVIKGWGHDFPPALNARLGELITQHLEAATA